jgi:hypothetical protein
LPQSETALRVVAADSPELRRVDTHSRTIALEIPLSGTEPKWDQGADATTISRR